MPHEPRAYYNEHDKFCAEWLRNLVKAGLISPGDVDDRDVRDVLPSDLAGYRQVHLFAGIGLWSHALRMAGWSDDRPVWTISCPCQPFSQAGGGAGVFDDRHLWPAAHWLVAQHAPGAIIGEQVASPDGLEWFDIVSADLGACGYACGPVDFPSAGVGAPNIRQRLYWVADTDRAGRYRVGSPRLCERWQTQGGEAPAQGDLDRSSWHDPDGCGQTGRLGDAKRPGLPHAEPPDLCGAGRRGEGRAATEPSGPFDPWRELEWIYCRDTRWRPAQSGIFPLAPRHPGDVAKLRAYGNAINPIVASQVIRAWMELCDAS